MANTAIIPPAPQSIIDAQLDRLSAVSRETMELTRVLFGKIEPILRPVGPTSSSEAGHAIECSPLALDLMRRIDFLESVNASLSDVISRVEL